MLLKSVIFSMPIHLITVLQPPRAVLQSLERMFADFLWGSSEYGLKLHWRRWKDLCYPVEEGGLGFKSLDKLVEAFGGKLWWRFRQRQSLWATFLWEKYVDAKHPVSIEPH